ncbi:4Fe-4S single cluster domain-containing protein [Baaleninema sp.]|uniref:4Fe-4S single cluster domain-containing protein n=1 Tax=Baaleninema sp. TaxID=3101197 RepID=UPI003CFC04F5
MTHLRIFRRQSPVEVLGPGKRAVIWVQGCPFACPGCIVPESWDADSGETLPLHQLAAWILAQPHIEGITLSGGEPMMQAEALTQLIDNIRQQRDLGVMCYTGHRLETLQQRGTDPQRQLLQRVDLLVDGLYRQDQHDNRLWRGSRNQRLLLLTPRYRTAVAEQLAVGDTSAGLSFVSATNGEVYFTGVPAIAEFRQQFETQMQQRGIHIRV